MVIKIHADLINGIIDVEGSEEFVTTSFKEFRESFSQIRLALPNINTTRADFEEAEKNITTEKSAVKSKPKAKSSSIGNKANLAVVQEFHDGKQGKDFLEEIKKYKIPDSEQKAVVLFIYIMQKVGLTSITLNHVYTCYRLQLRKTPNNLGATINNAKTRLGLLMYKNTDDIRTNHKGDDFVLLELFDNS